MSSTRGHFEGLSERPDHRMYPRSNPPWLTYVELGEENGGIALNISEGGLAVTAAEIVLSDYYPSIRFQLSKSTGWIETSGQVVWTSDSKKSAGIQFDGLTEVDREKIHNWISAEHTITNESGEGSEGGREEKKQSLPIRGAGKGQKLAHKLEVLSAEDETRFAAMFPSESSLPGASELDWRKAQTDWRTAERTGEDSREGQEFSELGGSFGTEPPIEPTIEGVDSTSQYEGLDVVQNSRDTDLSSNATLQTGPFPETSSPADTRSSDSPAASGDGETVGKRERTQFEDGDSLFGYKIYSAGDEKPRDLYFREEDSLREARESLGEKEKTRTEWTLPTITYPQQADWRQQFDWNRGQETAAPLPQQALAIPPRRNSAPLIAGLGILAAAICFFIGVIVGNGSLVKLLRHDGDVATLNSPAAAPLETATAKSADTAESGSPQSTQSASSNPSNGSPSNSSSASNGVAATRSRNEDTASNQPSEAPTSRESGESVTSYTVRRDSSSAALPSGDGESKSHRNDSSAKSETSKPQSSAVVPIPPEMKSKPQTETTPNSTIRPEPTLAEKPFSEVQGPILVTPPDEESGPFRLMLAEQAISASQTLAISAQRSILIPAQSRPASAHRPERLQAGVLIYHVDPEAPADGNNTGGTVKVRATIGKGGDVVEVQAISGPTSLIPRVVRAVREWRYTVTLLDGQPLGAEEEVVVEFRPKG